MVLRGRLLFPDRGIRLLSALQPPWIIRTGLFLLRGPVRACRRVKQIAPAAGSGFNLSVGALEDLHEFFFSRKDSLLAALEGIVLLSAPCTGRTAALTGGTCISASAASAASASSVSGSSAVRVCIQDALLEQVLLFLALLCRLSGALGSQIQSFVLGHGRGLLGEAPAGVHMHKTADLVPGNDGAGAVGAEHRGGRVADIQLGVIARGRDDRLRVFAGDIAL